MLARWCEARCGNKKITISENDGLKEIGQPIRLNHYRMTASADQGGKSAISLTINF
jgi:hypothetical protein